MIIIQSEQNVTKIIVRNTAFSVPTDENIGGELAMYFYCKNQKASVLTLGTNAFNIIENVQTDNTQNYAKPVSFATQPCVNSKFFVF